LDSLSLIRHFLAHIVILFRADCNFLVEFSLDSPTAMTAVSSANVAVVLYTVYYWFLGVFLDEEQHCQLNILALSI
jgi:hypothetical protein